MLFSKHIIEHGEKHSAVLSSRQLLTWHIDKPMPKNATQFRTLAGAQIKDYLPSTYLIPEVWLIWLWSRCWWDIPSVYFLVKYFTTACHLLWRAASILTAACSPESLGSTRWDAYVASGGILLCEMSESSRESRKALCLPHHVSCSVFWKIWHGLLLGWGKENITWPLYLVR